MGKCISYGACDKNYIYFYLSFLLIILVLVISFNKAEIISFNVLDTKKSDNILLITLLSYIGQSLFIFVELILNKYFFKNKSENNIPEENEHKNIIPIKYIFNNLSNRLTKRDIFNLICFSLLLLSIDIMKAIMIKIYQKEDDIILFGHYYSNFLFFLFLFSILFFQINFININIFLFQ